MPTPYTAGVTAAASAQAINKNASPARAPLRQRIPFGKVLPLGRLARHMLELIDQALAEDGGGGAVTAALRVPEDARGRAVLTQKAPGGLAGMRVAEAVFHRVDPGLRWHAHAR